MSYRTRNNKNKEIKWQNKIKKILFNVVLSKKEKIKALTCVRYYKNNKCYSVKEALKLYNMYLPKIKKYNKNFKRNEINFILK